MQPRYPNRVHSELISRGPDGSRTHTGSILVNRSPARLCNLVGIPQEASVSSSNQLLLGKTPSAPKSYPDMLCHDVGQGMF